jgi:PAS domain S-box-containing protein
MPVPALQRFERFFQASSDCQFYVRRSDDGQFRYAHVNPAALSVAGRRTEREVVGLTPLEALGPDYGRVVEENIETAARTGQTHHFRGLLGTDPRGPVYDAFYFPLHDDAGNVAGVLGSARDITEISQLTERVVHGEKLEALGTIAGSVVHDFNNIIAAFQALLNLLDGNRVDETRRGLIFEEGRRTLENGKALTERLALFARREKITARPHDICRLLTACRPVLERVLGTRVELTLQCDAEVWRACCNRSELGVALVNLATNARDAMGDRGHVVLSAVNRTREPDDPITYPAEYVEVTFRDDGTGMDADTAARAIDPFFTTKPEGRGTGLGLSSIARFMAEIDGALRIDSQPGQGTAVSLILPRVRPD